MTINCYESIIDIVLITWIWLAVIVELARTWLDMEPLAFETILMTSI